MEEDYDIEEINSREQRLVDLLQENINEIASASNQENYIINLYVREFTWQARDFESIYALKMVLESVIEDYEMNTEDVLYKIIELMPHEDDFGASNVIYELNNESAGYIYLMMNPSMNGIIKIGLTRRTPEERLEELSKATGVPTPFILVFKEQFNDCVRAEKMIHAILEERRERVSSNREFFSTEISEAIKVIQQVKQNDVIPVSSDYVEDSYSWYDEKPISKEYLEKGIDYLNGYGNYLQDYERAVEYLEKAGELGEAHAYYELGTLHIDTIKEDEFNLDVKKAIKYFEKGRVLTGKYSNYCNGGLALCYANKYFENAKIKNYLQNDANAEKCWEWFFKNLDFNNSDYLAGSYIHECLNHFLLNHECSSVYKNKLEPIALSIIKMCRYDIYETVSSSTTWKDMNQYLLSKFPRYQLDREVIIKWLRNKESYEKEGTDFDVLIEKGSLKNDEIISLNGYGGGAYRIIESLWKDGIEVTLLSEGERGTLKVTSVLDDFGGYVSDNTTINIIGNDKLEERKQDISSTKTKANELEKVTSSQSVENEVLNETGLLGKMKSWFK
ncbi:hypothetical protein PB01_17370 [Psychrobacillus glaciei]|uniref:Bacteriophage T5 Orf172 DNA-binding domain-containing protein n=1 Tax=Psychrobacillus glaciei TaxID=2283160 RepID=A0A5J6SQZ9_9BACI|nr:GIY-YIG nuclease family protein [Psychrobacillus glaciei]QFG00429.1 hypothetical protein PB01_17370 [Psychrobacillus glaciei]